MGWDEQNGRTVEQRLKEESEIIATSQNRPATLAHLPGMGGEDQGDHCPSCRMPVRVALSVSLAYPLADAALLAADPGCGRLLRRSG